MEIVRTSDNRTLNVFIFDTEQSNSSNKSSLDENLGSYTEYEVFSFTLKYGLEVTIALSLAYILVFIAGVFGNVAVFFIVKRTPRMRTLTNQFIANLAAADLLVIIFCLPFTLAGNIFPAFRIVCFIWFCIVNLLYLIEAWSFGAFFCKLVPYLQGVSVSASVNTLMAISIDRCMAISCPLSPTKSKRIVINSIYVAHTILWDMISCDNIRIDDQNIMFVQKKCTVKHYVRVMLAIWMIALTINLPWLFVFGVEPMDKSDLEICVEKWPSTKLDNLFFIFANLILCYLGPLVVISVCYILIWTKVKQRNVPGDNVRHQNIIDSINRSRLKVAKMVFVVILTFAVSWLPLYIIFVFIKFFDEYLEYEHVRYVLYVILPIAQWLGASNSCINPILFAYMNRSFRISLMKLFTKLFWLQRSVDEDDNLHLRNFSSKGNYKSKIQIQQDSNTT